MSEKINLNQEKLEMFCEQFGSSNFRLQSKMAEDYGKTTLDLYFKSVDFVYKIATTIGVIAGFGFVGLGYVKSMALFIFGEMLLFAAIAVGIWSVQKIYLSEKADLDSLYSKIRTHFREYNDLFDRIFYNKALKNDFSKNEIQQLMDKGRELLGILRDEGDKIQQSPLIFITRLILILFTFGTFSILLSFISNLLFFI